MAKKQGAKLILVTLAHDHGGSVKSMSAGKMRETGDNGEDMRRMAAWAARNAKRHKCCPDRDACTVTVYRMSYNEILRSPLAVAAEDIP